MGQVENSLFGKPHYKQCKNCGCEFRVGKGINSKGKKLTKVGLVFAICTLAEIRMTEYAGHAMEIARENVGELILEITKSNPALLHFRKRAFFWSFC